MGSRKIKKIGN